MKTRRTFLIASGLALALMVSMLTIGCEAARPGELCGWWKEVKYERHFAFTTDGEFEFEEPEYTSVGTGTWTVEENEVSIELSSGHMNWAGHTATAPSTLIFEYSLSDRKTSKVLWVKWSSGGSLTLTKAGDTESVTYSATGRK